MKPVRRKWRRSEEDNVWPSFTDIISTIAIILFFVMLLMYINTIVTGKNLEFLKENLQDTQRQLESSKAAVSRAEEDLRLLKIELEKTMAEVKAGERALALSKEEIERQSAIIAESNAELGKVRQTLHGIALLRLNVLESVKTSVESALGKTNQNGEPLVTIADNGNIIINESLVFDRYSYVIKDEGRALLDQLGAAFEAVLSDPSVRNQIDAINIQGHTDSRGTDSDNRLLGSRRSTAVVNYLLANNRTLRTRYADYFMASSYSEARPVSKGSTERAYAENRRIEIGIVLKDSHVRDILDTYFDHR